MLLNKDKSIKRNKSLRNKSIYYSVQLGFWLKIKGYDFVNHWRGGGGRCTDFELPLHAGTGNKICLVGGVGGGV